ncbi:MAG: hypothetical protein QM501_02905 [Gimesia sp.]
MKRSKDQKKNIAKIVRYSAKDETKAWDFIEDALQKSGNLFPTTDDSVDNSEPSNDTSGLPPGLKDVNAVLDRGRKVLKAGLNIEPNHNVSDDVRSGFAAAARNGSRIPESMLEKMHHDRKHSEKNEPNDAN